MSSFAESETKPALEDTPPKKSWVPTCLIGCGVILVLSFLACAGGFYWVYSQGPIWAMDTIVAGIDESDLPEEEKREIVKQIDRVKTAYRNDDIGWEDFGTLAEKFVDSPLMAMLLIFAAEEKYIKPSGLDEMEKADAKRIVARVARGVVEEKIDETDMEDALDIITLSRGPNNQRQIKETLTDEELREFIAACKDVADTYEIPDEDFDVKVSSEVRKVVDALLGEGPVTEAVEEEPASEHGEVEPAEVEPAEDGPKEVEPAEGEQTELEPAK